MKILLLNFILSTAVDGKIIRRKSNTDTMIYTMARGFVNTGHEVTLAAAKEFEPLDTEDNPFDVIYFNSRLPLIFKPHLLPWPKGLGKYIRKNIDRFDLIISVEAFSFPTVIAAKICRKKLLVWQEMAFMQHLFGGLPAKFWYHFIAPRYIKTAPVVCQSENAKEFISQFLPNISEAIIGHGADAERFHPAEDSDNYFVVISMLVYRKRIDRILKKFSDFLRNTKHKDYSLQIIGEGPELENLKQKVQELGIGDNVIFNGFLPHDKIAEISRRAKALLIDTQQDNNMVTIPESIVNGTPVLTNLVPNNSKFITNHNLGIAKDDWQWHELETMIDRYDEFHKNCIANRDMFSNEGCAKKLIKSYIEKNNKKPHIDL